MSMKTRAMAKPPTADTSIRIVVQGGASGCDPAEWVGELPSLHSKNKTVDQRIADADAERIQDVTRPHGVERHEYLEAHLQDALAASGQSPAHIPLPLAEVLLPDHEYRALYPLTLPQKKITNRISTRKRHPEYKACHRVYASYCMDEIDRDWLNEHNSQFASGRAESTQPVASTSSSATAVDTPMEIDDDEAGIRVKTEPLPDRSSVPRSPVQPLASSVPIVADDSQADQPVPDRTTPNGSGPPHVITHYIRDERTSITEDQLEFVMHHFECYAYVASSSTSKPQIRRGPSDPHFQTLEALRNVMEPGFPSEICNFIHNCQSDRGKAIQLPCICTHLTLIYPHWMSRRETRSGRCLQPQLEIPVTIADDGTDPYIVFRSTSVEWQRDFDRPRQERSRNPRRERERQIKKALLAALPKRLKLHVTRPQTPPPPPPAPVEPSPAPSTSTTVPSPVPPSLETMPGFKPKMSHPPAVPFRRPRGRPSLRPVPIMPKLMPIVKDSSQTPVEMNEPPPSNVDPAKNGVGTADFFSVEDARSMILDEPVIIAEVLSPLTVSEPAEFDRDPDA